MKRVVYINPGDCLEVRFIRDPEDARTAKAWYEQFKPSKMLIRLWHDTIAPADPATRIDRTPEAWK